MDLRWISGVSGNIRGESGVYPKISTGAQIGWRSRKSGSRVFCILTPLYQHFRPCHVSQTINLEEIYRFVSKILNFMPCGLALGRFCVLWKNFIASASKIYRKSIQIVLKFNRNSIEILPTSYRNSIELLSEFYRKPFEILSTFYWIPIEIRLKCYRISIEIQSKFCRNWHGKTVRVR